MSAKFNKSRLIALLTVLVMIVSLVPAAAFAATTMYAKTSTGQSVNVHSDPTVSSLNVIGHVPYSGKVKVLSSDATWARITYGKTTGYVLLRLLTSVDPGKKPSVTATPVPPTPGKTQTMYVKTSNGLGLNVRSSRSTKSNNLIGSIPNGSKVSMLKDYGTWAYVTYGKTAGYVVKSYLSTSKPEDNKSAHTMYVTSSNGKGVNFRSSAKKGNNILGVLPVGTQVTAYATSSGWTKIVFNGLTGYMQSSFLTAAKP